MQQLHRCTFHSSAERPAAMRADALWFVAQRHAIVVLHEDQREHLGCIPDYATLERAFAGSAMPVSQWRTHYLGQRDCHGKMVDCYAAEVPETTELPDLLKAEHLRALNTTLGEELWTLAGRALQITEWDRTTLYCSRCGEQTERSDHEHAKRCPVCRFVQYPRLAPAVIMLVRREVLDEHGSLVSEVLLSRSPHFPQGMYSTQAGFVEPGESLEEAVRRETFEETGITLTNIRYFGSQPWPFPHSLMIGFLADYAGGELRIDGNEIEDARWFRIDALPQIPPRMSIARQLIESVLPNSVEGSSR